MMNTDEFYMQRCLQLALLGIGRVQPNPMVGAVIVLDNKIIGEGWHQLYGQAHAEVNALHSVKDKSLLSEATMYVNLEPCSHFGKTPPCADAVIKAGIRKVVIGTVDIHSKVNGEGIRKLLAAGVEVKVDVCKDECLELNKRFFTYHAQKRPYIILKWAQTADGYMDIIRNEGAEIKKYWISNEELKVLVHKWRSEEDAILVGYNTMKNDNPQLTTRLYPGKNPQRFVMQRGTSLLNPNYTPLPEDIQTAMTILYQHKIESVIVEGGKKTLMNFIANNDWDEARILIGPQQWGNGLPAPILPIMPHKKEKIGNNFLIHVRRHI